MSALGSPRRSTPRLRSHSGNLRAACLVLITISALAVSIAATGNSAHAATGPPPPVLSDAGQPVIGPASGNPTGGLNLSISTSPSAICVNDTNACSAGAGSAEVKLNAEANGSTYQDWPAVQMVFVLEATPFDGVYDPTADEPGNDECAENSDTLVLCEESNGVPFFAANAGVIASSIAAAHPDTHFSFGLVDYFASHDQWDNSAGSEYHVDVGDPLPASEFGSAVNSTFVSDVLTDKAYIVGSDMRENFLESSSITALYGTLMGAGIDWANDTHHVIVWIGSTAPMDPNYPEDYCGTETAYDTLNLTGAACYVPTCEPSNSYGVANLSSPDFEGWIAAQDGDAADSIAALANGGAPSCDFSLGGNCTIDTLELWTGTTDPISVGDWREAPEYGPDINSIFNASCQLAYATDGSWDGPSFDDCLGRSQIESGTLRLTRETTYDVPNTVNPTLLSALTNASLGRPPSTIAESGGSAPMFTFVTNGNIEIDPYATSYATCTIPTGPWSGCQAQPTVLHVGARSVLEWNWSNDPNSNDLIPGDNWTAYVQIIATGPPFQTPVPVDACTTNQCVASRSIVDAGYSTETSYRDPGSGTALSYSFPLSEITVVSDNGNPLSNGGPPPPPATGIPPPVVLPTPVSTPVPQPVVIAAAATTVTVLSIQAAAGGLLAGGFTRIWTRSRPQRMAVGVRSPAVRSAFDKDAHRESERSARFE